MANSHQSRGERPLANAQFQTRGKWTRPQTPPKRCAAPPSGYARAPSTGGARCTSSFLRCRHQGKEKPRVLCRARVLRVGRARPAQRRASVGSARAASAQVPGRPYAPCRARPRGGSLCSLWRVFSAEGRADWTVHGSLQAGPALQMPAGSAAPPRELPDSCGAGDGVEGWLSHLSPARRRRQRRAGIGVEESRVAESLLGPRSRSSAGRGAAALPSPALCAGNSCPGRT